jgi:DNA-binding transcriptional MerR regulator
MEQATASTSPTYYSIGDLATRFGVSAESLRNWERQGLIPPSGRTPGKHRRYTESHVVAISQIMDASTVAVGQ